MSADVKAAETALNTPDADVNLGLTDWDYILSHLPEDNGGVKDDLRDQVFEELQFWLPNITQGR